MKRKSSQVVPARFDEEDDKDAEARRRLEDLAATMKRRPRQMRWLSTLCLTHSPSTWVENMKNMYAQYGVVCALIWSINVAALREPMAGLLSNNTSLQACGILNAIGTVAGLCSILVSMVIYFQLDLIPNDDSMAEIEELLIHGWVLHFLSVPQNLLLLQCEMIVFALSVESVCTYGVAQPAGWVMVAFSVMAATLPIVWEAIMGPRIRRIYTTHLAAKVASRRSRVESQKRME